MSSVRTPDEIVTLYFVYLKNKIDNLNFLKIGVTSQELKYRLKRIKGFNKEVVRRTSQYGKLLNERYSAEEVFDCMLNTANAEMSFDDLFEGTKKLRFYGWAVFIVLIFAKFMKNVATRSLNLT